VRTGRQDSGERYRRRVLTPLQFNADALPNAWRHPPGPGRACAESISRSRLRAVDIGRDARGKVLVCIVRRMPRMQVYLPDDLYEQVKARHLPASELLQEAVRAEVRRQDLLGETDSYLAELLAEAGEPAPEERMRAETIARRIVSRRTPQAS